MITGRSTRKVRSLRLATRARCGGRLPPLAEACPHLQAAAAKHNIAKQLYELYTAAAVQMACRYRHALANTGTPRGSKLRLRCACRSPRTRTRDCLYCKSFAPCTQLNKYLQYRSFALMQQLANRTIGGRRRLATVKPKAQTELSARRRRSAKVVPAGGR